MTIAASLPALLVSSRAGAPVSRARISRELGRLHPSQILIDDGRVAVVTVLADQAPGLLAEVARLQGEPGEDEQACAHLVAVDRSTGSVIGGYAMSTSGPLGQAYLAPQWRRSERGMPLLELAVKRWQRLCA